MDLHIIVVLFLLAMPCMGKLLSDPKKNSVTLPPCELCKQLVTSFKKGMERTSRGNFAGGDTAWEEEKLGSYYRSEVRLVEIEETLCMDVEQAASQCHSLAEKNEIHLENWWFNKQNTHPDLQNWLCNLTLKLCCPAGHFGPSCEKCPGYPDNICMNNGNCKGDGTRTGNGQCICNKGYAGNMCENCATNFFKEKQNNNKVSCSRCHKSCKDGCSAGTATGCTSCKPGWHMKENIGCVDIDECMNPETKCKDGEVCVNNEGSFSCQDGVYKVRELGRWVRYSVYICVSIAAILSIRRDLLLGSFAAIFAATYISASEIMMSDLF